MENVLSGSPSNVCSCLITQNEPWCVLPMMRMHSPTKAKTHAGTHWRSPSNPHPHPHHPPSPAYMHTCTHTHAHVHCPKEASLLGKQFEQPTQDTLKAERGALRANCGTNILFHDTGGAMSGAHQVVGLDVAAHKWTDGKRARQK